MKFINTVHNTQLGETIGYVTVDEIVTAYRTKKLLANPTNRGSFGVDDSRVKEIANNFDPVKVGLLSVTKLSTGALEIIDGHHRVQALLRLTHPLVKSSKIKNTRILVRVQPQSSAAESYIAGGSSRPHTAAMKITNPKVYLLAKYFEDLGEKSGIKFANPTMWLSVADAAFAYQKQKNNVSLRGLYSNRRDVTKYINSRVGKDKLPISEATTEAVVKALVELKHFFAALKEANPMDKNKKPMRGEWNKLPKATGVVQLLLVDFLSSPTDRLFKKSKAFLAQKSIENSTKIIRNAMLIAKRGDENDTLEALHTVLKCMGADKVTMQHPKWKEYAE